jgi:hypothetical protein
MTPSVQRRSASAGHPRRADLARRTAGPRGSRAGLATVSVELSGGWIGFADDGIVSDEE